MKRLTFDKILFRNYMFLIMITALLISIFSAGIDARNTLSNEKRSMYESLEQAQININNHTQMIEDYLTLTHSNPDIQNNIKQLRIKPGAALLTELNDSLFSVDLFKKNLDSVQIFAYGADEFLPSFSSSGQYCNALFAAEPMEQVEWFQNTKKAKGRTYWYVDEENFKKPTLCAARILFDNKSPAKVLGVLKANVAVDKLIRHLGSISFGKKGAALILADHKLYQPDSKGRRYTYKSLTEKREVLERSHLIVEFPIITPGYQVIGVMSNLELFGNTLQNLFSIGLVLILSILLAVLLSSRSSHKISLPIHKLCLQMSRMEEVAAKEPQNCIEISQLYDTYNSMLVKNATLIKSREETVLKFKQAEMAALQSQMNPHFIYNTLESVNALISIGDNEHASLMVSGLGSFLRSSLNNGNNYIPLAGELAQVSSYFQIQQLRYAGHIELKLDTPKPLPDLRIIKLLLQPLVENSIVHGFKDMEDVGIVTITVYIEDDYLVLSVADNGWGSDIEMLNYLVKQRTLYREDNMNFYCIQNVYQRLKNCYGENSSFYYEENRDGGVTAVIRVALNVL